MFAAMQKRWKICFETNPTQPRNLFKPVTKATCITPCRQGFALVKTHISPKDQTILAKYYTIRKKNNHDSFCNIITDEQFRLRCGIDGRGQQPGASQSFLMALKYLTTTSYKYKYQNVEIQSRLHTNTNRQKYKSNKTDTKTKGSAAGCILVFPYGAQIPNHHLIQIETAKCRNTSSNTPPPYTNTNNKMQKYKSQC